MPSRASCLSLPERGLQSLDDSTAEHPAEAAAEVERRLAVIVATGPRLGVAELYAILADAHAEQSHVSEAMAATDRGLDTLARAEPSSASVRVAFRLNLLRAQMLIDQSDSTGAVAAVGQLLAGIAPSSLEYACALSVRAMAYQYLNEPDRSAADALAAYRLADVNGWADARQELAYSLAGLFAGAGLDQQAQTMLDVVTDSARTRHQTSVLSTAEYERAVLFIHARRFPEALSALDRSIAESRQNGDRFSVAAANVLRCWALINQHELQDADAVCNSGERDLAEGQREDMLTLQRAYRARLDLERGRPRDALALLRRVLSPRIHQLLPRQEPQIHRDRGRAYFLLGRYREAAADLAQAADIEAAADTDARNRQVAMLSAVVTSEKLSAANELLRQRMLREQEELANQRQARRLWTSLAVAAALVCLTFAYLLVLTRRRTRDLRRHEIILRNASSRAPDAIVLLDQARIVRFANRNLCGEGSPHAVGEPIGNGVPKSLLPALLLAIEQSFVTQEVVNFSAEIDASGPAKRLFDMCILPAVDGDTVLGVTLRSIEVTEVRALEREVMDGAALERQRLSSELHEGLGQQLAGILLMLGSLVTLIKRGLPGADRLAAEISDYVVQSIESTQHLARGLAPVQIGSGSLNAALQSLVKDASRRLHIHVSCECRLDDRSISDIAADHLYRICREAITNGALHGRCTRVDLELGRVETQVVMSIYDDGMGLPSKGSAQEGFGVRMMAYRAQALGGSMNLSSMPQGGTRVIVRVPMAKICAAERAA